MTKTDYFAEILCDSLKENADVTLTNEQLEAVANDIEISHENIGLAFYTPCEHPSKGEIKALKEELWKEKSKIICRECSGTGSITTYGGTFMSTSQCDKCHGAGRHLP